MHIPIIGFSKHRNQLERLVGVQLSMMCRSASTFRVAGKISNKYTFSFPEKQQNPFELARMPQLKGFELLDEVFYTFGIHLVDSYFRRRIWGA